MSYTTDAQKMAAKYLNGSVPFANDLQRAMLQARQRTGDWSLSSQMAGNLTQLCKVTYPNGNMGKVENIGVPMTAAAAAAYLDAL